MFQIAEWLSTFIENLVVLSAVTQMAHPKNHGKKNLVYLWGFSFFMMLIILLLNQIQAFSFVTIAFGFACAIFLTRFTAQKGFLHRFTATVIAYLCVHATDYILIALYGLLDASSQSFFTTFQKILEPGMLRLLFLFACKTINLVLYFGLKKKMKLIRELSRRYCSLILIFGLLAYIVMSLLLGMVQTQSYVAMQSAILLVWVLLVICVVAVICIFVTVSHYQQAEQRNALLRSTNELMVSNYQKLNANQQATRRQVHDFQNHLQILQEFASTDNIQEMRKYLDTLMSAPREKLSLCNCGNDVIDAIINCKAVDARAKEIDFQFDVQVLPAFLLDPVDICAILSNQIDNAFEACQKIPDLEKRKVTVKIWLQNDHMVFFQVKNTVRDNPFLSNTELQTTKENAGNIHGFGIQNIRDTCAKYGGELSNVFQDDIFISTVYLFMKE